MRIAALLLLTLLSCRGPPEAPTAPQVPDRPHGLVASVAYQVTGSQYVTEGRHSYTITLQLTDGTRALMTIDDTVCPTNACRIDRRLEAQRRYDNLVAAKDDLAVVSVYGKPSGTDFIMTGYDVHYHTMN
jgi:hypothetical protein